MPSVRFAIRGSIVSLITLLARTPIVASQAPARTITSAELGARLRLLSSDLFEGRFPGSRGESLTTSYLISELTAFGVQPGVADWLQPVPMVTHDPAPDAPVTVKLTGKAGQDLAIGRDLQLANNTNRPTVSASGDLVFVGYGIAAPVYRWDDFAGIDLHGKIAVALLGEPDLPGDSIAFNGVRASRYSWTRSKVADMERLGAVGVLWVGPARAIRPGPPTGQRRLRSDASRATLLFTGTIADSAVARLVGGPARWRDLAAKAARPGFRAVPIGARLEIGFQTRPRDVISHNVVATIAGTDRARAAEHVVLTAHWDAYGILRPVAGDSIANGAMDDGSGVTELLALARVFAADPLPRSLTFLFTTAEEWGLLGAEHFVCSGVIPADRMVANLNLDDGPELFGKRHDVAPLGVELSSLGQTVAAVAHQLGLRVTPDPLPQEGFFLRADNYPFAEIGVPALYLALGTDDDGHPAGFASARIQEYLSQHYHAPSDDYPTVALDLDGARQLAEFTRDVTVAIGSAPGRPDWLAGVEFQREAGPPKRCR